MTPRFRKFALTAHVTSSVGWLGAVAAFLALAVAGLVNRDPGTVRGGYVAMDLTARFVIVPLALAALLTGLVQAVGTTWGLFRHYWVVVKLLVTLLATVVLLLQLEPIRYLASAAAQTLPDADLRGARMSLVAHAGGGLLVLLVPTALSVYKPRGLTPYGWRRDRQRRALQGSSQDARPAGQAGAELRAAGEKAVGKRPPAGEKLSAQELQIAQLAAEGLSNRELGQRLAPPGPT